MNRLAPWWSFGVSVAFWPQLVGAATTPRWVLMSFLLPFVTWPALLFVAYCFWRLDFDAAIKWAFVCGAFGWGVRLDDVRPVVGAFATGLFVSGVVAAFQTTGLPLVPQTAAPGGLFLNKNLMGEAAALCLVCALWFDLKWPALLCLPALILSQCGAAWGGAVIGAVLFFQWRAFWAWVFLVVGLLWWHGFHVQSLGVRLRLWHEAVTHLTVLGNGEPYGDFFHNEFLQVLYALGVGAVVLYFAFFRIGERALPIAGCFAVIATFGFPLHMPATAFLIAVVGGHLVEHVCVDGRVTVGASRLSRHDAMVSLLRTRNPQGSLKET